MNALKFKEITEKQLEMSQKGYMGANLVRRIKSAHENMVNITCTKHYAHDGVFYISDCGAEGFRVIKFYSDDDYRAGGSHGSLAEAYSYAVSYM